MQQPKKKPLRTARMGFPFCRVGRFLIILFGRVFCSKYAGSRHSDTRVTWVWSLFYLPHFCQRGREGLGRKHVLPFRSAWDDKLSRGVGSRAGWSGGMVWYIEGDTNTVSVFGDWMVGLAFLHWAVGQFVLFFFRLEASIVLVNLSIYGQIQDMPLLAMHQPAKTGWMVGALPCHDDCLCQPAFFLVVEPFAYQRFCAPADQIMHALTWHKRSCQGSTDQDDQNRRNFLFKVFPAYDIHGSVGLINWTNRLEYPTARFSNAEKLEMRRERTNSVFPNSKTGRIKINTKYPLWFFQDWEFFFSSTMGRSGEMRGIKLKQSIRGARAPRQMLTNAKVLPRYFIKRPKQRLQKQPPRRFSCETVEWSSLHLLLTTAAYWLIW